ncbi:hypothetical protein BO79DRAFT_211319 [Aspergillus costaricaensis CBS 115574]|uniref:Uncharacterized protein n=1 Tax=Aspergillus costaricaensis CBS 115574 TaxID=1448317 RepID=A0ACD1I275_9EURO|nr:hypothetical protein BO79DRAFT_211319 [Aspergillus costaricaensis CBS 115574]RAK84569.1 hypothetical protein BO79DRAFT_211319 [Aspergillus costaricaensis CBS 115574]
MQKHALALFTIAGMHPAMTGRKMIAAEVVDNRRVGVLGSAIGADESKILEAG